MTKEELKKEATEYALEWGDKTDGTYACCRDGYLAGAEPREKRIAELEHQLTHRNCLDCSNHSSKLRMRTLELEKENAELKEQISNVRECFISASSGDDFEMAESAREVMEVLDIPCYRHKDKREKSKLTKAKELLKKWVELYKPKLEGYPITPIQEQTEQFLKDCEVEK